MKRPHVVEVLRHSKETRPGAPDLDTFLDWLWPHTGAPQRRFRANAMWLHKHLAELCLPTDCDLGQCIPFKSMILFG